MTLKCILAIKHLCGNGKINLNFEGCEIPFSYKDKKEKSPQPDFICQQNNEGIYGEIKSSITSNSQGIEKEINDLTRLNEDLVGWKTEDNTIEAFSIWLLIYSESLNPFLVHLKKRIKEIKRKILISKWERVFSIKKGSDVFKIEREFGSLGITDLDSQMNNGAFEVEEDEILDDFENIKFFRRKPPVLYTIQFLWIEFFPLLSDGEDFTIKIKEVFDKIKEFYPCWANISGENEQIRISWIKEAFEVLEKIGYCKKKNGEEFEVFYRKNPGHHFEDRVAKKICGKINKIKQESITEQKKL